MRVLSVLDSDTTQFYNLTVVVTDGGSLKTNCMALIEVLDLNDNAPRWEREFYHFNTSSKTDDAFIGTVMARDIDSGVNAEVRYALRQKWVPFKVPDFSKYS